MKRFKAFFRFCTKRVIFAPSFPWNNFRSWNSATSLNFNAPNKVNKLLPCLSIFGRFIVPLILIYDRTQFNDRGIETALFYPPFGVLWASEFSIKFAVLNGILLFFNCQLVSIPWNIFVALQYYIKNCHRHKNCGVWHNPSVYDSHFTKAFCSCLKKTDF